MIRFHRDGTLPQQNEVFVFGSNLAGRHGAGAAKVAHDRFGAIYGVGVGFQPNHHSYAIPTKDERLNIIGIDDIRKHVHEFIQWTLTDEYQFFVTRIGCGLAGYRDEQIAPMFRGAVNCSFAQEWEKYLK